MSRLMDPKDSTGEFPFKWVNSASTDIRETFKRIRAKNAASQAGHGKGAPEAPAAIAAPISLNLRRRK